MTTQKRLWYGCYAVGIAPNGSNTFTTVHGLQSVGVNTRFNLEHVFELGQSEVYESIENVPDIEITMEKVLDGNPLIYHLMTAGRTSTTLIGRSNQKAIIGISYYNDINENASGTPLSQCTSSGMFVSNLQYQLGVNGNCTESVTAVGNNKLWTNSFTGPAFDGTDVPTATDGVQRRENVLLGSGNSKLPKDIPGVTTSGGAAGFVETDADGGFNTSVQSIRMQANLGREAMYELGHKAPYHRYVQFPVEVRTDIEIMAKDGDKYVAIESAASNVTKQTILIKLSDATQFDLGAKNICSSVTQSGGNAQQNGGNVTQSFSYVNFNKLTVTASSDPG